MSSNSADMLRAAATGKAVAQNTPKSFPQLLEQFKPQLAAALPKHISADRMVRVALTCFRLNPKLAECDPASVFAAVVIGSQLGLEPGIMGQGFLVPYKKSCQFIPGWQGLVDIVSRSGRASVWTGAVFSGDTFEYEYGSSPRIHHIPSGNDDQPDTLTHVYAVGRVKGAEFPVIEVWPLAKVLRHRDRYNKVGDRHYSYDQMEMYARKVALLQVLKYMPKSIELATAVALDQAAESGSQLLDLKEAIEGSFTAPETTETPLSEGAAKALAEASIRELRSASTIPAMDAIWLDVVRGFKSTGGVPIDVEAVRNERRDQLSGNASKA
jgi:recombination protein RecT